MARHVALLRAINVGGRTVKMDALRATCEACGLTRVETFIASGNVIFESRGAAPALEAKLEKQLRRELGYEVATFIRSPGELARAAATAEKKGKAAGAKNIYVGFMKEPAGAEATAKVLALASPGETFAFDGREMYWMTNAGVSDSKFSNAALERITRSPATFRNVTTVRKLAEKYL